MCKPRSCCGKHHKHYVYNTKNMEGVCVRHNDDCTAVCVPRKPDPTQRQVCSKGCNRMLKVPKATVKPGAITDKELFDIVVCQVDHRIVCEAWKLGGMKKRKQSSPCKTTKWVKPVAKCIGFDAKVWNEGATCIANAAHNVVAKAGPANVGEDAGQGYGDDHRTMATTAGTMPGMAEMIHQRGSSRVGRRGGRPRDRRASRPPSRQRQGLCLGAGASPAASWKSS